MLARLAIRLATIAALKGKTFVGDNVLDSEIDVLDVAADDSLRTDQDRPFVAVYVDGSKIVDNMDLRSLHKSGPTDLVIEVGIAATMTEMDQETGESRILGVGIPVTDPAMEFYLDCVGRQIVNALSDPNDAWAEIWRGLSASALKIERKRTSDASGTRIAAHQFALTLDLLPDPVFGAAIAATSIWAKLFAQMEADQHPFLETMQSLVGAGLGTLEHEARRRRFGMTLDEARSMLDIAVPPAEDAETPITNITVYDEG